MGRIDLAYKNRVRFTLSYGTIGSLIITEPIGWDDEEKEYARNEKYHGVFTKFSNNLEFIEDGADFINNVRDSYDINAEIRLLKEERHPQTDRWTDRYEGVLDLSTWQQEDFKVKVKFNSSGLETELKARESKKIEIERTTDLNGKQVDPLETHLLDFKGRNIFLRSKFEGNTKEAAQTRVNSAGGIFYTAKTPFPMSIVDNSDPDRLHNPIGQQITGDISAAYTFYGYNDRQKELRISLNLSFLIDNILYRKVRDPGTEFIKLMMSIYSNGSNYDLKEDIELYDEAESNNPNIYKTVSVIQNITRTLLEGESIMLYFYTGARTGFNNKNGYFDHDFINCTGTVVIVVV